MSAGGRARSGPWRWTLVLVVTLVAAACSAGDPARDGLTVFAAASLRVVTDELESAWNEAEPDVPLVIATEASNVLAAQIAEGAEADVFLSADAIQPERLAEAGLTAAQPVPFARNRVALVAASDGAVKAVADLARPGVRLVLAGPETPIGRYAASAIAAIAATQADTAGVAAAIEANVVSREDNVRAALAKVELGEGDAAFVYRSDALGSTGVEIELPPAARVAADYTSVVISDDAAARRFQDWLLGPVARGIFTRAGFEAPA